MIIKSMSRKAASFGQLIQYITSGQIDERYNVFQNVYRRDYQKLTREFEENSRRLPKRKNGVYLYHEVLSITRAKVISEAEQKEIFCQLAQRYAQQRAGENLVFGGMHDDKAHNLHYHFVISANKLDDSKRLRMSKAEFSTFKKDFEAYVLEHYPELEQAKLIQKESGSKLSKKGGELQRRTGKLPERNRVTRILEDIFESSFSHGEFIESLDKHGFDFYIRGKNPGVLDRKSGRKYRLRTLGLIEQLEALDDAVAEKNQVAEPKVGSQKKEATQQERPRQEKVESGDEIRDNAKDDIGKSMEEGMESSSLKESLAEQRAQEMRSRRKASSQKDESDQKKRGR